MSLPSSPSSLFQCRVCRVLFFLAGLVSCKRARSLLIDERAAKCVMCGSDDLKWKSIYQSADAVHFISLFLVVPLTHFYLWRGGLGSLLFSGGWANLYLKLPDLFSGWTHQYTQSGHLLLCRDLFQYAFATGKIGACQKRLNKIITDNKSRGNSFHSLPLSHKCNHNNGSEQNDEIEK